MEGFRCFHVTNVGTIDVYTIKTCETNAPPISGGAFKWVESDLRGQGLPNEPGNDFAVGLSRHGGRGQTHDLAHVGHGAGASL